MGRYKIMSEMDGQVVVADPPAYIRKVLQLAGIHRLTRIVTDISPYIKEKDTDVKVPQENGADAEKKESDKIETQAP